MAETFDLLGDPIPDNWGGRGRPPHIPTVRNRNRVILLLAMDWDDEKIAGAIGITKPTLKKHYFRELRFRDEARSRVEAGMLETLYGKVREGSVPAIKELRRMIDQADLKSGQAAFYGAQTKPKPAPRLGKKEQAVEDAKTAGADSDWGSDLLPQPQTH